MSNNALVRCHAIRNSGIVYFWVWAIPKNYMYSCSAKEISLCLRLENVKQSWLVTIFFSYGARLPFGMDTPLVCKASRTICLVIVNWRG